MSTFSILPEGFRPPDPQLEDQLERNMARNRAKIIDEREEEEEQRIQRQKRASKVNKRTTNAVSYRATKTKNTLMNLNVQHDQAQLLQGVSTPADRAHQLSDRRKFEISMIATPTLV